MSAISKVATATPSTFVLSDVITVPVVLASPVVIEESPTLNEPLLPPVLLPKVRLFATFALLCWPVVAELLSVDEALLLDPTPFPEFPTDVPPPAHVLHPPFTAALLLPVVVIAPLVIASPVPIVVSPTFPLPLVPPVPESEGVFGFTS